MTSLSFQTNLSSTTQCATLETCKGTTDGSTDAARMGINGRQFQSLFDKVLSKCKIGMDTDKVKVGSTWGIVESLILPFCARFLGQISQARFETRFVEQFRGVAWRLMEVVSPDDGEQTYTKYWLDLYLFKGMGSEGEYPKVDTKFSRPLLGGILKRLVMRSIARRDLGFLYSLQKGSKQSWPQLGKVKEHAALKEHMLNLSKPRKSVPDDLLYTIRETSRKLYGHIRTIHCTKFLPSGRACLEASLLKGGALSLTRTFEFPMGDPKLGVLPHLTTTFAQWRREQHRRMQDKASKILWARGRTIKIVIIPEPGKFRILSKGSGYVYSALQPVQGAMLDAWKGTRYSTMRDSDLTSRLGEIDSQVDFPYWRSGDYSKATDLISRQATVCAMDALHHIPNFDLALASVSQPYYAMYPEDDSYPDDPGMCLLTEGQLMGHPLSFGLLCCINLSVYRQAVKDYCRIQGRKKYQFLMDNVIINGDDILFKSDVLLSRLFDIRAGQVGFQPSPGKDYLSLDCALINSQIYIRRGGVMARKGYLNQKLIYGKSLKGGVSKATATNIATSLNDMCRLLPWGKYVIHKALSRFDDDVKKLGFWPNWYIPQWLGGVGIEPKFSLAPIVISREQRKVAAMFASNPKLALFAQTPSKFRPPNFEVYSKFVSNYRWFLGAYVERQGERIGYDDEVVSRIAMMTRAAHYKLFDSDQELFRVVKFHVRHRTRLSPMDLTNIESYWNVGWVSHEGIKFPPLAPISQPSAHMWSSGTVSVEEIPDEVGFLSYLGLRSLN
jgi:hypothetical protein